MSLSEKDIFWYEHCTEEQEGCVKELAYELEKRAVEAPDHLALKRFLRARQWDVRKATSMYMSVQEFRRTQQVDKIVSDFVFTEEQSVLACYPRFNHKTDRWGRPVYIELLGQCNVTTLLQVTTLERFLKQHIKKWEMFQQHKLPACSAAAGRPIISTVAILDLEGLSIWNFTGASQQFIQAVSRIDQDYYPEHLGAMYIINAPFIFRSVWAFVKPLLDEGTAAKMQVLGASYQEVLLSVIPAENLWTRFGGTSVIDKYVDVGPWTVSDSSTTKLLAAGTVSNISAEAGAAPVLP